MPGQDSPHSLLWSELCPAAAGPAHLSRARFILKLLTHNPRASPRHLLLQPNVHLNEKKSQRIAIFLEGYTHPSFITWYECFHYNYFLIVLSHSLRAGLPGGSVVVNPPARQETWVRSLGREDPLEEEMTTYSSHLVWEISWTEEPGRLPSRGLPRV